MAKLKLKRDWIGRFVQLRRRVGTVAGVAVEAGTVMEVLSNHGGLRLTTLAFDSAWQQSQIVRGVPERDVLLLHFWMRQPDSPFVFCRSCGTVRCADGSNDRAECAGLVKLSLRNAQ